MYGPQNLSSFSLCTSCQELTCCISVLRSVPSSAMTLVKFTLASCNRACMRSQRSDARSDVSTNAGMPGPCTAAGSFFGQVNIVLTSAACNLLQVALSLKNLALSSHVAVLPDCAMMYNCMHVSARHACAVAIVSECIYDLFLPIAIMPHWMQRANEGSTTQLCYACTGTGLDNGGQSSVHTSADALLVYQ